jgi:DNA-binding NtrC family response regulator
MVIERKRLDRSRRNDHRRGDCQAKTRLWRIRRLDAFSRSCRKRRRRRGKKVPSKRTCFNTTALHPNVTLHCCMRAGKTWAEIEKRAILASLKKHKGDALAVAEELGIGKTTVYRTDGGLIAFSPAPAASYQC